MYKGLYHRHSQVFVRAGKTLELISFNKKDADRLDDLGRSHKEAVDPALETENVPVLLSICRQHICYSRIGLHPAAIRLPFTGNHYSCTSFIWEGSVLSLIRNNCHPQQKCRGVCRADALFLKRIFLQIRLSNID